VPRVSRHRGGVSLWSSDLRLNPHLHAVFLDGAYHERHGPEASARHMGILPVLWAVGIVYAALIALAQPNLRRMLAFSSVSHVGFVMVGLASMTHQGMQGAVLQMITMGLVSTGLLFAVGFLYSRLGTSDLSSMGGLAARAPILTLFFFLIGLASIGLPGTAGFVGRVRVSEGRASPAAELSSLDLGK